MELNEKNDIVENLPQFASKLKLPQIKGIGPIVDEEYRKMIRGAILKKHPKFLGVDFLKRSSFVVATKNFFLFCQFYFPFSYSELEKTMEEMSVILDDDTK